MFQIKPVFYHKVGNPHVSKKIVYKYYFGSVDPHFYFSAYVVPFEETYSIFFNPVIDNIVSSDVIDMTDSAANAVRNIAYGDTVELRLSNDTVAGVGEIVHVAFSIDEPPSIPNMFYVSDIDKDAILAIAKEHKEPIDEIGLYGLSNVLLVETEAKLMALEARGIGSKPDGFVRMVFEGVLKQKPVLRKYLSFDSESTFDTLYSLYMKMFSISPSSVLPSRIFSDIVEFSRIVNKNGISLNNIPYDVMFRIFDSWATSKHTSYVNELIVASENTEKSEVVTINMSNMEDTAKVVEIIEKSQSFVYIKRVEIKDTGTGETVTFNVGAEYYKNYVKSTSDCIERKGIPAAEGVLFFLYGYGAGCDSFGSIYGETPDGRKYGYDRNDEVIGNEYITTRSRSWGFDRDISYGNVITNAPSIEVTLIGV